MKRLVSPWISKEHYAYRVLVESPDVRVAFIEKTPRVRISENEWKYGPKGVGGSDGCNPANELYGYYPPSRKWCDDQLLQLGYTLLA